MAHSSGWPTSFQCRAYVQAKVGLDGIPFLVQQGPEPAEDQDRYFRDSDEFTSMHRSAGKDDNVWFTHRRAREILIRHAIATQRKERTLALLSDFRRELDQSKSAETRDRAAESWRRDQFLFSILARRQA
jgi:hypothetical protein